MTGQRNLLWYASSGAAELSWLGAWSGFSAVAILGRAFPILPASAAFILGAIIARQTHGKGWRRISALGLHVFAFVCISWGLMYLLYHGNDPPSTRPGMLEFIFAKRDFIGWLVMVVQLFWAFLFYRGGVGLARRERDYYTSCRRFDFGLSAFFVLFLTKFLFASKAGLAFPSDGTMLLVFPFFLFGLFSIGTARYGGHGARDFLAGYAGPGIIAGFAALAILLSSGLLLFFLPILHHTADAGLEALKITASPVTSFFVWIIRFLYMPKAASRPQPSEPGLGIKWDPHQQTTQSWWVEVAGKIIAWGLSGLLALLLLALIGVAVFYLARWLLHRMPTAPAGAQSDHRGSWLVRVKHLLLACYRLLAGALRPYRTGSEVFAALTSWGARSGCARLPCETPLEFGARLRCCFPLLKNEFAVIINAFDEEAYAGSTLSSERLGTIKAAMRRLRSPAYWWARLKVRLGSYPPSP